MTQIISNYEQILRLPGRVVPTGFGVTASFTNTPAFNPSSADLAVMRQVVATMQQALIEAGILGGANFPVITTQPANITVNEGESGTFTVVATGGALEYQWRRNGVNISGATSATYITPVVALIEDGDEFDVVVLNPGGSVTSNVAVMTVKEPGALATGGTVTDSGPYRIHTFTGSGTLTWTRGGAYEYLIAGAGGGGGGTVSGVGGGGGGGGEVLTGSGTSTNSQAMTITIGLGGNGGPFGSSPDLPTAGGNSSIDSLIATGGSRGGHFSGIDNAVNGGAGRVGGGGTWTGLAGSGSLSSGGAGQTNTSAPGGGGGGAGGNGSAASAGGNGGVGVQSAISGSAQWYGGGGGGARAGVGGSGVGGNGTASGNGISGVANTGGGGGGAGSGGGGTGAAGVVVIRYER
jgi:hypothetical protein